jgi:hypothetical protein
MNKEKHGRPYYRQTTWMETIQGLEQITDWLIEDDRRKWVKSYKVISRIARNKAKPEDAAYLAQYQKVIEYLEKEAERLKFPLLILEPDKKETPAEV